jgi:hypothetical protein
MPDSSAIVASVRHIAPPNPDCSGTASTSEGGGDSRTTLRPHKEISVLPFA